MALGRPTFEQTFVLGQLHAPGKDGTICYYKGGFWSAPGNRPEIHGASPKDWNTGRSTVTAMERRGWLRKLRTSSNYPIETYPGLEDRQLTDEGRRVFDHVKKVGA